MSKRDGHPKPVLRTPKKTVKPSRKLALVTGATSGIGEAVALELAKKNMDLVITGRRKEKLEALAKSIREKFLVKVTALAFDVSKRTDCHQIFKKNSELLGQVEILVNNAGLARGADPLHEGREEDWEEMIDTNVKGLLYVTRFITPFLAKRESGHIVNIGSVAGHWVYPTGNVYCATKFAVRALTEGLRMDLHGKNVRVTNISPGMVETEFSRVRFRDDKKAKAVYAGMSPLTAHDIAECVVWSLERPAHVNIQEMLIFATQQSAIQMVARPQKNND